MAGGLDAVQETLTIAGAAARLGIAPDAVRKRIRRGSLKAIKVDGCWRVVLDGADAAARTGGATVQDVAHAAAGTALHQSGAAPAGAIQHGVQAAAGMPTASVQSSVHPSVQDGVQAIAAYRELVGSLREEVTFLRRELETRSRELEMRAEEVRRRDLLLDAMAQRLRQLPPPVERVDDHQAAEHAPVAGAEVNASIPVRPAQARPWWRFW